MHTHYNYTDITCKFVQW